MKIYEVRNGVVVRRHDWPDDAPVASHKLDVDGGPIFRPVNDPVPPTFDPLTQVRERTEDVTQSIVNVSYNVRAKTTEELNAEKDAATNNLNNTDHKALLKILQSLVNDNRRIKRKVNQIITQQGIGASVPVFPADQTTSPQNDLTLAEVKTLIRGLLDV